MTLFREKVSFALLFTGVALSFAVVVVATSDARVDTDIYYEAKGAEQFDGGVGYAVPKQAIYWFAGAAAMSFGGAYLARGR